MQDLPTVIQSLIIDYLDNVTYRDMLDAINGSSELEWLHFVCNKQLLQHRQAHLLSLPYMCDVMTVLDRVETLICEQLPMYKIDFAVMAQYLCTWLFAEMGLPQRVDYRPDLIKSRIVHVVDSFQRLTQSGPFCIGLAWTLDLDADTIMRLCFRADLEFHQLTYSILSRAFECWSIAKVIAPVLDRFIWSRPELFHHSKLSDAMFLEFVLELRTSLQQTSKVSQVSPLDTRKKKRCR